MGKWDNNDNVGSAIYNFCCHILCQWIPKFLANIEMMFLVLSQAWCVLLICPTRGTGSIEIFLDLYIIITSTIWAISMVVVNHSDKKSCYSCCVTVPEPSLMGCFLPVPFLPEFGKEIMEIFHSTRNDLPEVRLSGKQFHVLACCFWVPRLYHATFMFWTFFIMGTFSKMKRAGRNWDTQKATFHNMALLQEQYEAWASTYFFGHAIHGHMPSSKPNYFPDYPRKPFPISFQTFSVAFFFLFAVKQQTMQLQLDYKIGTLEYYKYQHNRISNRSKFLHCNFRFFLYSRFEVGMGKWDK